MHKIRVEWPKTARFLTVSNDCHLIYVQPCNEAHNIPTFLSSLPPEVALIGVDASQDATADVMLALRPDQTFVIRHSSRITEARQIGAEAARTTWLLFTDADVVFAPDYFERLLTFQGYEAIYGPKLSRDDFMSYYRWFGRGQEMLQQVGIPAVSGSNLLVSRRAFSGAGGFDLRLICNE